MSEDRIIDLIIGFDLGIAVVIVLICLLILIIIKKGEK